MNKGQAKPKRYMMYAIQSFDGKAKCFIHCYTQQKWECAIEYSGKMTLSRKGTTLVIPKEDFEQNWSVVL